MQSRVWEGGIIPWIEVRIWVSDDVLISFSEQRPPSFLMPIFRKMWPKLPRTQQRLFSPEGNEPAGGEATTHVPNASSIPAPPVASLREDGPVPTMEHPEHYHEWLRLNQSMEYCPDCGIRRLI